MAKKKGFFEHILCMLQKKFMFKYCPWFHKFAELLTLKLHWPWKIIVCNSLFSHKNNMVQETEAVTLCAQDTYMMLFILFKLSA